MPIIANYVSMVNFPGPRMDRILPETIINIFTEVFFFGKINSLLGRKRYPSVPKTTTVSRSSSVLKISPGTRIWPSSAFASLTWTSPRRHQTPGLIIAASGWGNMLAKPSTPIHKLQRKNLRRLFIPFSTYVACLVYSDLISSPRNENSICLPVNKNGVR